MRNYKFYGITKLGKSIVNVKLCSDVTIYDTSSGGTRANTLKKKTWTSESKIEVMTLLELGWTGLDKSRDQTVDWNPIEIFWKYPGLLEDSITILLVLEGEH